MEAAGLGRAGGSRPGARMRARLLAKRTPPLLLALAAAVAVLVLLPLGFLLDQALSIGWSQVEALLFRPFVGTLLRTRSRWSPSQRPPASCSASASPGPLSAPTCPADEHGRCSPHCR